MNKIKVLFIVSEFYQSGTSRFAYEINKALNKSFFETSFLSLTPLNNSSVWKDYYDKKHAELGSNIYFLNEIYKEDKPSFKERVLRKVLNKKIITASLKVTNFLQEFDTISLMGEYNYAYIKKFLNPEIREKLFIHPQNSVYQQKDNYNAFEQNLKFNIVSGFLEQDLEIEFNHFEDYKHTYLPLSFELPYPKPIWEKIDKTIMKIGIFTRLGITKPLDPFFYSFQVLLNKLPNVEFHIFGSGDPVAEGMERYVKQLGIESKVFFRGHQSKMLETANSEKLDLVWLHGYHSLPGGFAGYDISSLGIPQVFWDFGGVKREELKFVFPMTNKVIEFAELSERVLTDFDYAYKLRDLQFDFTDKNQNILNFIVNLEQAYKCIVNR